jgi:hypothetical protein
MGIGFKGGRTGSITYLAVSLYISISVCTIHTTNSSELIRKLEAAGWELRNIKGSHHVYVSPNTGAHI